MRRVHKIIAGGAMSNLFHRRGSCFATQVLERYSVSSVIFFFQAEDGIRDDLVTGVQTCALPICAIVMLNLKPAVTRTEQAKSYRDRIVAALSPQHRFEPLMTLYLTDVTPPDEIRRARDSGVVHGVKLYPSGATTHSDSGVSDLQRCTPALEAMQELDLPLLVPRQSTDPAADVVDRQRVFIDTVLVPLRRRYPAP